MVCGKAYNHSYAIHSLLEAFTNVSDALHLIRTILIYLVLESRYAVRSCTVWVWLSTVFKCNANCNLSYLSYLSVMHFNFHMYSQK